MTTYILRRLLLMVPTLFGISLVVWLVMALAPGRPGQDAAAFGQDKEEQSLGDASKDAQKGQAQRIFRNLRTGGRHSRHFLARVSAFSPE